MQLVTQRLSLVAQAAQLLREAIQQGDWMDELPGERNLCTRLGVSRPTLRAALEQLRREGWLAVTHGRPTRILHRDSAFQKPRSAVVAMLSPVPLRAMPPFVMFWVDELRARLAEAGYQLEIHDSRACFGDSPDRAIKSLHRRVPAAVWVLFRSTERMQRWFADSKIPCLVAGSCWPGICLPSVDVDYRATCRHAAGMLLGKGHRNIVLLLPEGGSPGDAESESGFQEALTRHRGETNATILRHDGTSQQICRHLDAIMATKTPPTALVIARTAHTLTALTHLLRRGVRIPEQLAIVSRDDDAFLQFLVPPVARYASDPAAFALRALRMVLQLIEETAVPTKAVRMIPKFLPGETVEF